MEEIEITLTTLQGLTSKSNLTENEAQKSIDLLRGCSNAAGGLHSKVGKLGCER